MKFKLTRYVQACAAIALLGLFTGCSATQQAEAQQVGADLISDVGQGTVIAADGFAAYQALNQSLTAANVIQGKLDPTKVLAAAQAILGVATSPATASLTTAVNTFVADASGQIAALKASGVTSTTAITNSVSTSGAATVTAIAALAPASTTTSMSIENIFWYSHPLRPLAV